MERATLRYEGSDLRFTWPNDVQVLLRNVRESSGDLSAIVSVQYVNGVAQSLQSLMAPSRLNLVAPQSRKGVATLLDSRQAVPGMTARDWIDVLEYACGRTYTLWERGEPFISLDTHEPAAMSLRELLPPIAIDGEPVVLVGDGGSGKSTLAAALALSVMSGRPLLAGLEPARQVSALVCDWESNADEVTRRLVSLARGAGIDRPPVRYRPFYRALSDEIATVEREVAACAHGLVVIDSVAPASAGSINDAEAARDLFGALRRLSGVAKLLVAHINKADATAGGARRNRVIGNIMYENLARAVWEVKASEESAAGELAIGLYQRKHNGGARHAPLCVRILYGADGQPEQIVGGRLEDYEDLAEKLPVQTRLGNLLSAGALSTSAIADALGITPAAAAKRLRRARGVTRLSAGGGRGNETLWGLSAPADPSEEAQRWWETR